ncbi:hypothetical protein BH10PSE1_BH10PSE1_35770 [soil metagenome]
MATDRLVASTVLLALVAHVAAIFWLLRPRHRLTPILTVNILVSVGVLAYQATRIPYLLTGPADGQVLALIAFEIPVFGAAFWSSRGRHLPVLISGVGFAVHLCAAIAAAVFMLMFKMDRLI